MNWSPFPRLLGSLPRAGAWDPWRELSRIQSDMSRLFGDVSRVFTEREHPAVRISLGEEGAILEALLPGLEPVDIEISVNQDTLTLKGGRAAEEQNGDATWHRRERRTGRFARSFHLPFAVSADAVEASFRNGVLEVHLPRSEADKPRKIQITTS